MTRLRRRRDPALCEAAAIGDLPEVEWLLAAGVDADSADSDGAAALALAACAGHVDVVARLLAAGADPDEQDVSGRTALMAVVATNGELDLGRAHPIFLRLIDLLVSAGADLDLVDENGDTALDLARSYELDEIVDCLGAAGSESLSHPTGA